MHQPVLMRIFIFYGIGSIMGAVATVSNWLVREFLAGGLSSLAASPTLGDYYMPMVWGGICGLLFLIPIHFVSWIGRGIGLGIVPGLIVLSLKAGGFDRLVDFVSPDRFLRHDTLIVLLVYMFIWGLGSSALAKRY